MGTMDKCKITRQIPTKLKILDANAITCHYSSGWSSEHGIRQNKHQTASRIITNLKFGYFHNRVEVFLA